MCLCRLDKVNRTPLTLAPASWTFLKILSLHFVLNCSKISSENFVCTKVASGAVRALEWEPEPNLSDPLLSEEGITDNCAWHLPLSSMEADRTLSTSTWGLLEQHMKKLDVSFFHNVAADVFITLKAPRNDVVGNMYTGKIRPPQFTAHTA